MKNANLHKAKTVKKDEFYTLYEDIELEIANYKSFLKNKIIYCPCDDYRWSNFVKYFKDNFNELQLKKLIATNFDAGKNDLFIQSNEAFYYEFDGLNETIKQLNGNGDFRNQECVEILKNTDVIITNPPFSLARDFLDLIIKHKKDFIIISHLIIITYLSMINGIVDNKIFIGFNKVGKFIGKDTRKTISVGNIIWFTNIKTERKYPKLKLTKNYDKDFHKKYDNYDAINCNSCKDIPVDYFSYIGVPTSYIIYHNPTFFRIVGVTSSSCNNTEMIKIKYNNKSAHGPIINNKEMFRRLIITRII